MAISRVELKNFLVFNGSFAADFCAGVNVLMMDIKHLYLITQLTSWRPKVFVINYDTAVKYHLATYQPQQ